MVDGTGTSTYVTDSLHRLTSMTSGAVRTVGYGYDIGGRLLTLTYPGSRVVTRGFDDAGRLTSAKDWLAAPTTSTFGYDNDGNWTTTTYGNGDTGVRAFNNADQLTGLTYKKGAAAIGTLTYTRSNAGLLNTAVPTFGAPGTSDTFTYNPRAQLTSRDNTGTNWAYDNADRITKLAGGTTLAYDNGDQPTVATPTAGATTTFTYDNRGNRTASKVTGAATSTLYGYDQANRLTTYTPAGGAASTYGYDGDGLRANATPAGTSALYMQWDMVSGGVPLLVSDFQRFFIYGPGDTPVEQIQGTAATYIMGDQLGSTILLSSPTGTVTGTWAYDAYGNTTSHSGTGSISVLYDGQYQDLGSGIYYLIARYFDPVSSQFLTSDPRAKVTRDRYGYASQLPNSLSDPSGLDTNGQCFHVGIGAGVLAGFQTCGLLDDEGNFGVSFSGAGGLATPSVSLGLAQQISDARDIYGLGGPFQTAGGSVDPFGEGVGLTGDYSWGQDSCGNQIHVVEAGFSANASGFPFAEAHGGASNTQVYGRQLPTILRGPAWAASRVVSAIPGLAFLL